MPVCWSCKYILSGVRVDFVSLLLDRLLEVFQIVSNFLLEAWRVFPNSVLIFYCFWFYLLPLVGHYSSVAGLLAHWHCLLFRKPWVHLDRLWTRSFSCVSLKDSNLCCMEVLTAEIINCCNQRRWCCLLIQDKVDLPIATQRRVAKFANDQGMSH